MQQRQMSRSMCAPIIAAWLLAMSAPVAAQSWIRLLKNTPAERFDAEDIKLFLDASKKALSDTPAGEPVVWKNPASGSGGELKVVKSFAWRDHPCRRLRVTSETAERKGSNTFDLCEVGGKWKVVSPSELKR